MAASEDSGRKGRAVPAVLAESGRVEAFSDGVLAIAITLLVLDLKVPEAHVGHGLLEQWPTYLAYLSSFLFIGVVWVNHHALFTRIAAVVLYSGVLVGMAVTWLVVFSHLMRRPFLIAPGTSPEFFREERPRSVIGGGSDGHVLCWPRHRLT
jgi:hypothetical protein